MPKAERAAEIVPKSPIDSSAQEVQELERAKRQRQRSIAIALCLLGLVLLFYAATIVRLGGNALNRAM
jgi:accessory gene regulator protein AgrB